MARHPMRTRTGNVHRTPSVIASSGRRSRRGLTAPGREGPGEGPGAHTATAASDPGPHAAMRHAPRDATALLPPPAPAMAGPSSPPRPPASVASSASALQRESLFQAITGIQAQLQQLAQLPQHVALMQEELARVRASSGSLPQTVTAPVSPATSAVVRHPEASASGSAELLLAPRTTPPRVHVPTFDGTLGRWEPFWRQFEAVHALQAWDQATAGRMLLAHLRDAALDAAMALPEPKDDLDRLYAFLNGRFGAAATVDVCQAQLEGRIRRPGEDLYGFAREVEALARRTYPSSAEELIQREALAVFLNGVSPEAHKRIKYERARTVHEALAIAIQCESYAAQRTNRAVRATAVSPSPAEETARTAPVRRTAPTSESDARRSRPCPNCDRTGHLLMECTKDPRCFSCKKTGHQRRDCPGLSKSGQKRGRSRERSRDRGRNNKKQGNGC